MMKLRLIEQACGCCTVRGGGGRKERRKVRARSSLPLVLWWRVLAARTRHLHLQAVCCCNGSRHDEAPTDRASLRLPHGVRRHGVGRRQAQPSCLFFAAARTPVESYCPKDWAPAPVGGVPLQRKLPR